MTIQNIAQIEPPITDSASDFLWKLDAAKKDFNSPIFTYPPNHAIKDDEFENKPHSRPPK